jgi:hypothetical protein
MPRLIPAPSVIQAAGTKPKRIEEFTGRVNSGHSSVSVARMQSPSGWAEPGQRPEFEEITVVLRGTVHVEFENGAFDVTKARRSSRRRANGCATARRGPMVRSTSRCVCRHSRPPRFIATSDPAV